MESKKKNPITVVITGAAGNIAYAFYNLLLSGIIFGKD